MALVRQFLLQALVIAVPFLLQGCGTSDDSQPSKARKASEVVNVPGWPDVKGKFPLSFGIKAGSLVYASGMQGMDMKTMKLVEGGVQEETKQILKNLGELLQAAGSSMQQVTLCSVSLVNITRDFKDMNQAYSSFWPAAPPARVAVQVAALAGNASVEIQCTAALDGKNRTTVQVPGFPDLTAKGFPLSWATKVDGMLYLSGAQGMDMATGKVVSGGVQAETTQALQNLEKVLQAASSNAGRVVACSVSLTNMSDFSEMNQAYQAFWPKSPELGGLPSRVCVEVSALAGTGKVEIQCTAAGTDVPHGEVPSVVKVPGWPEMKGFPFSAGAKVDGIAFISGNQGVDMKTSKLVQGGHTRGGESLRHRRGLPQCLQQLGALARGAAVEIRCLAGSPPLRWVGWRSPCEGAIASDRGRMAVVKTVLGAHFG
ncbi:unnamed protein product, partial [Effrenium voratum]